MQNYVNHWEKLCHHANSYALEIHLLQNRILLRTGWPLERFSRPCFCVSSKNILTKCFHITLGTTWVSIVQYQQVLEFYHANSRLEIRVTFWQFLIEISSDVNPTGGTKGTFHS